MKFDILLRARFWKLVCCVLTLDLIAACTHESVFDADYATTISKSTSYPSFDRRYDAPEQLKACVGSWAYLGNQRTENLNRLKKQGVFDAEQYVFVERACGNGVCYTYTFVSLKNSSALAGTNSVRVGEGKFERVDVIKNVDVAAARALFEKLEAAGRNKWKDQISVRQPHVFCDFITVRSRAGIQRFAVTSPFVETGPDASPPVAILHHVDSFSDRTLAPMKQRDK